MQVYVTTSPGMGEPKTRMCAAVYTTLELALAAQRARGRPGIQVETHRLHGDPVGRTVYAAHLYEPAPDMFDLIGIYANHDTASRAATEPNMVTQHTLDS